MAQIKITITIEATFVRDAHEALDAMDALLRARGGRVVSAKLVPVGEQRDADGNKLFSLAKYAYTANAPRTVYRVNWDNGGSACGTFALTFDTFDEAEAFGNDWANECNMRDFGTIEPDEDCYTFDVIEQQEQDEPTEIDDGGRKAGLNMGQP